MKVLLFGLLLAFANANPLPMDEEIGEPVELIVNGVPEGEPLDIGHIVDIKLKKHVDGQVISSSDLLYPLTAQGLADAAAAHENQPEIPDVEGFPIVPVPLPVPELTPELVPAEPEPVEVPQPESPENSPPEVVIPGPIVLPMPVIPEVEVEPEVVEESAPQNPNSEIFNDGNVQVILNGPEETGVLSSIQNWFQMFVNYFSNGVQTSQQIF